jgi:hypothetical protein
VRAGFSAQAAANELNTRRVETPAGGSWHAMTVLRVARRLGIELVNADPYDLTDRPAFPNWVRNSVVRATFRRPPCFNFHQREAQYGTHFSAGGVAAE